MYPRYESDFSVRNSWSGRKVWDMVTGEQSPYTIILLHVVLSGFFGFPILYCYKINISFVFQGWLCMYMQCCYAALNPCTWYWWFGTCRRDVVLLFHYLYAVAIDSKGLYKTFYFVIRLLSLVGLSNLR